LRPGKLRHLSGSFGVRMHFAQGKVSEYEPEAFSKLLLNFLDDSRLLLAGNFERQLRYFFRLPYASMAKRFSDIEKPFVTNQPNLEERLKEYPELKAKIETMLAIIENAGADVEKAAEAEGRVVEELRQMGNEVLHSWDRRQHQKKEEEYDTKPGVNRKGKKSSTGRPGRGKSK
jgi:meiotically up-regulated gene 157 (Mug157) protein